MNTSPQILAPQNSFDNFLATHGKDKVKQIVDSYDTMVSVKGKAEASELITKYFGIDQAILDSSIKYVTKSEGRIIPVSYTHLTLPTTPYV